MTTITCKCSKCNGLSATLPATTLADLKAAEGKRYRAHLLVANAHGRDSVSALVRQRLNLQAA